MVPVDRTLRVWRMLQVTATTDDRRPSTLGPGEDDLVDAIVAEYEPIVARTRRAMAGIWQDRKVSKTTMIVLMQLELHGPVSMSRLAGLLDVGLPNMTGIVSRMEEHGLVERVRDEHDRRVVLVRATPRGMEMTEELEAIRRQHLRQLVTDPRPSDRQACLQAFRALREAAERLDRDDRPRPPTEPPGPSPPLKESLADGSPRARHGVGRREGPCAAAAAAAEDGDPVRDPARPVPGRAGPDHRGHGAAHDRGRPQGLQRALHLGHHDLPADEHDQRRLLRQAVRPLRPPADAAHRHHASSSSARRCPACRGAWSR